MSAPKAAEAQSAAGPWPQLARATAQQRIREARVRRGLRLRKSGRIRGRERACILRLVLAILSAAAAAAAASAA